MAGKVKRVNMDFFVIIRAMGALILVLGLIVGLAWALRKYGGALGNRVGAQPSDLKVLEWRALDVRRKLAVIRWDGREHLVCLGPAGDFKVAERPSPPDAALSPPPAPPAANDGGAT